MFANDAAAIDQVIDHTSAGGVTVNHTLLHLAVADLPFGGVGASGMGAYHGEAGFERFSHAKPVLQQASQARPNARLSAVQRASSRSCCASCCDRPSLRRATAGRRLTAPEPEPALRFRRAAGVGATRRCTRISVAATLRSSAKRRVAGVVGQRLAVARGERG